MANYDDAAWSDAFDRIWKELETGILTWYTHRSMPWRTYLHLCEYVISCCGDFRELIDPDERLRGRVPNDVSPLLLDRLKTVLQTVATEIAEDCNTEQDDSVGFLRHYLSKWTSFEESSLNVNGLWTFFNRLAWTRPVIEHAMRAWRDYVVSAWQDKIASALAEYMRLTRERADTTTEYMQISKAVIDTFDELDLLADNVGVGIYQKILEEPFLQACSLPLSGLSTKFCELTLDDYVEQATRFLQNEHDRFQRGIFPRTVTKLIEICKQELIGKHTDSLIGQLFVFVSENKLQSTRRLFTFLRQSEPSYHKLKLQIEEYVFSQANQTALAPDFPRNMTAMTTRFACFASKFFDGALGVREAIGKGLLRAMNTEDAVKLLAMHYHSALKRLNEKATPEGVASLDDLIAIYRFLQDKDGFLRVYARLLVNRLTRSESVNDDIERLVIRQFKRESGALAVEHLYQLHKSAMDSDDLSVEFYGPKLDLDFYFSVFGSNCWPFSRTCHDLALPSEVSRKTIIAIICLFSIQLESTAVEFLKFYRSRFSTRKLTILFNHSMGHVQSNCFRHTHLFELNTYEIAVMMLLNGASSVNLVDMAEKVNCSSLDYMKAVLTDLVNAGLLLQKDDQFSLNFSYSNTRRGLIKIKRRADFGQQQQDDTSQRPDPDIIKSRQIQTQCAIVRVVKMKGRCSHSELISIVVDKCSVRFTPTLKMLKHCIDTLIDRNYIRRSETNREIYVYVV